MSIACLRHAAVALALGLMMPAPLAAIPDGTARAQAEFLYRVARERLERGAIEERRAALEQLREAVLLVPDEPRYQLALGRANDKAGFSTEARRCYERARLLAPSDPEPLKNLGLSWKQEWLHHFEPQALDSALLALTLVTQLRPHSSDAWLALVALRCERGDLAGARAAAERAFALAPRRPGPLLARACLDVRMGHLERADTTFAVAIPRLDPTLQAFFEDIAPVADEAAAAEYGSMPDSERHAVAESFWSRIDPDPTTPESEALLEYRARAAYAWLLFFDPIRGVLDTRAEIYKRYGPPAAMVHNPMGERLEYKHNRFDTTPPKFAMIFGQHNQSLAYYPMNALVWHYPDVGMRILLNDRSLTGFWDYPIQLDFDPAAAPHPELVARRGDLMMTGHGRGLFHSLPPAERRLEVQGAMARFHGDRGPLLLVQVGVPGGPADTLSSRWVVLDSTGREIARGTSELELSACAPTDKRVASFTTSVPAGDYQVALSVTDSRARKGLFKSYATLNPTPPGLALSDIVLSCGSATTLLDPEHPRVEIDATGSVRGAEPLVTYFEIYGLAPEAGGNTRFEYQVRVTPTVDNRRWWRRAFGGRQPPPLVEVRREETNAGPLRRQFVTVPVRDLEPGRYRLEIAVRDRVSGARTGGSAEFVAN